MYSFLLIINRLLYHFYIYSRLRAAFLLPISFYGVKMTNKTNQPAEQGWFFLIQVLKPIQLPNYIFMAMLAIAIIQAGRMTGFYEQVRQTLQEVRGKELTIHINSYGGDVYGGYAIYSLIKQHDKK